ncbi:MAG TPA: DUF4855 domain-containing protein [Bacillota bacterium]|nr:DUF4855 domain-containing protein [Bacillota bacterium]HOK68179.1 DUF4855 domain-containing protein [Bacillota bacterium]HPP84977.1 DUF4855 domain-containing protein [Bacillota bacterium]
MKKTKLICFFLVLIFGIQTLTACHKTGAGGDTSSEAEEVNVYQQLLAVYKEAAVRGAARKREMVTLNKKYTLEGVTTAKYADDGKKLTDGVFTPHGTILSEPEFSTYVGAKVDGSYTVIVELGEVVQGICDFELSGIRNVSNASSIAKTVDYYVSTDGENYVLVGTSYGPDAIMNMAAYTHTLKLQNTVEAAYIKYVANGITSKYSMIDEVAAYRYVDSADDGGEEQTMLYYKNEELPVVETPVYWDASESDYNTVQNLLLGKKARIYETLVLDAEVCTAYYNTPAESAGMLTDGVTGSRNYTDSAYFHFTRGYARELLFDLEKTSTVHGFTLGCISNATVGIGITSKIVVSVSENGRDWMTIFKDKFFTEEREGRVELSGAFDGKYKARFIKIWFQLGSAHTWIDEITVTGTKAIARDAKDVVPNGEETGLDVNKYADPNALGAENILLTYTFKNENKELGLNTKEELLPYVAYFGPDGQMKDIFFDGYLFLACSTVCPSGGFLYHHTEKPAVMSDWIAYFDDLFYENCNVNALQEAVSEVKKTLNIPDFKAKVYFPIYATTPTQTNFGDVDGDGVSEDFSKLEDRNKAHKWWIDLLIRRFNEGGYADLELAGFYWNDETTHGATDRDEEANIRFVEQYVHSMNYKFFWIPYYMSTGFADWKEYGFDAATMQPNYMFSDKAPETRCDDNARMTKYLGMGVEIEAEGSVVSTPRGLEKYRKYLETGIRWGYMHSIKTYYQDAGPGVFYRAYKSADPLYRSVYDDTYRYAKRKLSLEAPELKTTRFATAAKTTVTGKLEFVDDDYYVVTSELSISPKFGSLKLNRDTFEYTPVSGFTGTDSFEIVVTSGIGKRTVTITIEVN